MFLSLDVPPTSPPAPTPGSMALRREESREHAVRSTHQLAAELPKTWRGTESQRLEGTRLPPAPPRRQARSGVAWTPAPAARGRAGLPYAGLPGPPPSTSQGSGVLVRCWSSEVARTRGCSHGGAPGPLEKLFSVSGLKKKIVALLRAISLEL